MPVNLAAKPFRIHIEQEVLSDLQVRLRGARWAKIVNKKSARDSWDFGTSSDYLRELINYWYTGYNWRAHESQLNMLPQFKAAVDGTQLHFFHVEGNAINPMPLLLLHGWPDSFYRFHKVIVPLSDPESIDGDPADAFHVVVPSLPGFAFSGPQLGELSSAVRQPNNRQTARLLWQLMTKVLGYRHFAVAGGDGGSAIAQILALDYPESVIGIHLTDLGWHATSIDASQAPHLTAAEQNYLARAKQHFIADGAYAMLQMTRPRTLAAGLNDSPVGLASWIVDRFHSWSDGYIADRFTKDELLTNIMLYWVTQTIGSSIFNYYLESRSPSLTTANRVERPVGLALFPKDIGGIPPRSFAERTLNVQRWTEMPSGGHFAALEEPQLYSRDVFEFFRSLRVERISASKRSIREMGHVG
jgi:microsomal epoxide hydrolase